MMIKVKQSSLSAFTLIELVFVLVLLGLLGGFAIPKMSNIVGLNQKSQVTKLAGFFGRAHQMAVLRGKPHRVVMDMDARSFWVEEQTPPVIEPLLGEEFKVDEVLLAFRKEAETFMDEENVEKRKRSRYTRLDKQDIQPASLPEPLFVESVYFAGRDERVREGLVYVPISPAGYHPTTIIYVARKDEIKFSLIFPSLSSRMRVERGEVSVEELVW